MKLKIQRLLLSAIAVGIIFTACKENDDLGAPDRLFRPIPVITTGGTWVKLSWERYTGSLSYELVLTEDSTFQTGLTSATTEDTEYTFDHLNYNTNYYVRMVAHGDKIQSGNIRVDFKTAKYPTKLLTPASNDYIDEQIRVKWGDASYDRLDVYEGKEFVKSVELTADDNEARQVIVRDLEPTTTYTVKVYLGDAYLGEMDYTTLAAQLFEGDYVDLRSLDPSTAYSKLTQAYFNELSEQYPNGFILVLAGGTKYEFVTVNLSTSVKIVTGLSFEGSAILECRGNFAVAAGANVGRIDLENITVTDHPSALKTSANFGGTYMFNFNQANGILGELSMINCDIRYKRGVIRAQVATQIGKITIDNCIIDSIGGYGVVNADHAQAYFTSVVIKNSTIAHAEKILIASKPIPTDLCSSITMENLTVCYAPKGEGNYIIDYNNQTLPNGLTMRNCIFGAGWDSRIRGMRSASTIVSISDSYKTNDLLWTLNAATNEPQNPIAELTELNDATTGVFADPQNVNFKVTNATLAGRIGDPRWW